MEKIQGEIGIRSFSIDASLGGVFGDILGCEKRIAVLIFSRSRCQKLLDEGEMGF
jgi:hypothetical protein